VDALDERRVGRVAAPVAVDVRSHVGRLVRHGEARERVERAARARVPAAAGLDVEERREHVRRHALRALGGVERPGELGPAAPRGRDARRAEEAPIARARLGRREPEREPRERRHARVGERREGPLAGDPVGGEAVDEVRPAADVIGVGDARPEHEPAEQSAQDSRHARHAFARTATSCR
jgi:hypothetical protein